MPETMLNSMAGSEGRHVRFKIYKDVQAYVPVEFQQNSLSPQQGVRLPIFQHALYR